MEIWSIMVEPFSQKASELGVQFGMRAIEPAAVAECAAAARSVRRRDELLPEAETLDQLVVAVGILAPEVLEQPAPPPDHLEQAAARVVVLRVRLEVLGQVGDAGRQQRDLDLRGSRVGVVGPILFDDVGLSGLDIP